jgi:hypothetical protein
MDISDNNVRSIQIKLIAFFDPFTATNKHSITCKVTQAKIKAIEIHIDPFFVQPPSENKNYNNDILKIELDMVEVIRYLLTPEEKELCSIIFSDHSSMIYDIF